MSKPPIDRVKFLSDFIAKLQANFSNKDFSTHLAKLSVDQAAALMGMRHKLPELVKMIQQIQAAKVNEAKIVDEVEKFKKREENEKKLDAVAQEIFIIACASTMPMDEVLKFQKESGLDDKYLNQFNSNELNPLAAALSGGRSGDDLQQLIDAGADVNFKSPQGNTSAHFAVMFDVGEEVLNVLIANDVDVNAKNNLGMTPLDMALIKQAERGGEKSPLIDILVSSGAEVSVLDGFVQGAEVEAEMSLKAAVPDLAKKSPAKAPPRVQSISGITKGGSSADRVADIATMSEGSSLTFDQQGDRAAEYLKSLGLKVGEDEDSKMIAQRALLEAVNRNQSIMALYLIDNGALITPEIAHAAIDTKNMNLIGMIISHATQDVMIGVQTYAEQTYTPAACLIDAAIDHSMLAAHTAGVFEEALILNADIMGVAHNKLSEQEVIAEKKQDKEAVEKKMAEEIHQEEERAAAIHEDVIAKENAAALPPIEPQIDMSEAPKMPSLNIDDNILGGIAGIVGLLGAKEDVEEEERGEGSEQNNEELEAQQIADRIAEEAIEDAIKEAIKEQASLAWREEVDTIVKYLRSNKDEGVSGDDIANPMSDSHVDAVQPKPVRGGGISV